MSLIKDPSIWLKDFLLGLVASIQLSSNKMLKAGDWISIPEHKLGGNAGVRCETNKKIFSC
jgi:small-conductance mechanosensitive channel